MKEPITISEMGTFQRCPRLYYLRYVKLWAPERMADELYFGTAWHAAMEARNGGATYEQALEVALSLKGNEVSELLAAQLSGLLAGYYARYGARGADGLQLYSEVAFTVPIAGTRQPPAVRRRHPVIRHARAVSRPVVSRPPRPRRPVHPRQSA